MTDSPSPLTCVLHVRMSQQDVHYGGGLVDGARILALFGDAATGVLVRLDGDEGLFRAYSQVEFLKPVRAGDFLDVVAELVEVGRTSRRLSFAAWRVIRAAYTPENDTAAEVLAEPELVARAEGTCVTPANKQRRPGP